ncbi:putative exopolygalacturonase C [Leucoagaricus sp. SymC.cos]|nr:putative exopolygalacturonase C [Leucoagaricus sp. SymC.cos]
MLSLSLLFLLGSPLVSRVYSAECTVAHSPDADADDLSAILKAFTYCQVDSAITFSQANYSAFTPVSLTGLKNVTVRLSENSLLLQNVSRVQHEISITQNPPSKICHEVYATPWFHIQGEDVTIIGSDEAEWGVFRGFGEQWWNVRHRILRPQLATFNVTSGLLRKLKVIKPIAWGWNLPGKNLRIEDHFVDAAPHNGTHDNTVACYSSTVRLNLSGQNITVDGYYGHNGGNCISVINGGKDIGGVFQTVQNVLFKNWTMNGAVYGARFKSWTSGQGFADNVAWGDTTLVGVSTGIFVTQKPISPQRTAYDDYVRVLLDEELIFLCIYATKGFKADNQVYVFIDSGDLSDPRHIRTLADSLVDHLPKARSLGPNNVLVLLAKQNLNPRTVEEYQSLFWKLLDGCAKIDKKPWPKDIPATIDDAKRFFCFAGEPFFTIIQTPAHQQRRTRYAKSVTIVFQPEWTFDILFSSDAKRASAPSKVRALLAKYNLIPVSPDLKNYLREFQQYFMMDENVPVTTPYAKFSASTGLEAN